MPGIISSGEQKLPFVGQKQHGGAIDRNLSDKVFVFKIFDSLRSNASIFDQPSSTGAVLMSETRNCR
jgi:hypothetical protein